MSDDLADLIIEYALPMGEEAAHDAAVAIRAAGYLSPADMARIKAEAEREALLEAAAESERRSEQFIQTGQRLADQREGVEVVARYGGYAGEAQVTVHWLRARAAAVTGGEQGAKE